MPNEKQMEKYETWLQYVRRELDEAQREAADPKTKWISADEMLREGEALLNEMESQRAAKSA